MGDQHGLPLGMVVWSLQNCSNSYKDRIAKLHFLPYLSDDHVRNKGVLLIFWSSSSLPTPCICWATVCSCPSILFWNRKKHDENQLINFRMLLMKVHHNELFYHGYYPLSSFLLWVCFTGRDSVTGSNWV